MKFHEKGKYMNTNKHENLLHKELSYEIQGAAMEVRKNFGSGHKENVYQNAFAEELQTRGITFEKEKSIQIYSPKSGKIIGSYRPDFIVEDKVVIELKALESIPRRVIDQLYDYLRNSKYELGYFINFASPKLYLKRIIYTNDRKPFLEPRAPRIKTWVYTIFVIISFLFVAFRVYDVHAATLRFDASAETLHVGDQFEVAVLLDTQNESINAVEGELTFSNTAFRFVRIRDGGSIINFWVRPPNIAGACEEPCRISFSGVVPGGFAGRDGFLFAATFRAEKETQAATFSLQGVEAFLSDGQGTEAQVSLLPLTIPVEERQGNPQLSEPAAQDSEPPEPFMPAVARDSSIFDGNWFLAFAAADRQSGIDHYEIQETGDRQPDNGNWIRAESPYVLKDQTRKSFIHVKAFDRAGNERVATVNPEPMIRWYNNPWIFGIVLIGILAALYTARKLLWKQTVTRE
jgi:GxxExxY protein